LHGLRGVALGALGGLQDEGAGFGFELFELEEVAVEFAGVGAEEGVAFAFVLFGGWAEEVAAVEGLEGAIVRVVDRRTGLHPWCRGERCWVVLVGNRAI